MAACLARPLLAALAAVAVLAGLGASAPAPARAAGCPGADVLPSPSTLPQVADATLCLLNEQRAAHGLAPTRLNAQLTAASVAYARRMVAEAFFAHVAPDGRQLTARLLGAGYIAPGDEYVIGENLAWGQGALATPRSTVSAWMNSPGHRANVLSPEYQEIGLGIALGTPVDPAQGATMTADYGARTAAARPARATPVTTARAARSRCGRVAARGRSARRTRTRSRRGRRARTCATAARSTRAPRRRATAS